MNHLYDILVNHLVFQSYLADPDVCFKAATYKTNNDYYTYILVYVDDLIIFYKDHRKYMAVLESNCTVKLYIIGEPKVYLGDNVGKLLYDDGKYSPNNPFSTVDYGPELDTSMECN